MKNTEGMEISVEMKKLFERFKEEVLKEMPTEQAKEEFLARYIFLLSKW